MYVVAHFKTSMMAWDRGSAFSLRGPDVSVLITDARKLNRGPQVCVACGLLAPPTAAVATPPCCDESLFVSTSERSCNERSTRGAVLFERIRYRELSTCPEQAEWRTPRDS